MKEDWIIKTDRNAYNCISSEPLNSTMLKILANRGISSHSEVCSYLYGKKEDIPNGFLMKDFEKALVIIKSFIGQKRKIIVYGDYDADGVCSTAILMKALIFLGANCSYYIPDRVAEGYGMHEESIRKLYSEGAELIITCDNGITAPAPIALAKELGMTIVVTDHHIPQKELNADAIVDPKQSDCPYPFKELCGTGIALKFALELCKDNKNLCNEFYQLASLATVCDQVSLVHENRLIVKTGLSLLNDKSSCSQALKVLIKCSLLDDKVITEYHLGYILGPIINASGRLKHAKLAVDFLLEPNVEKAESLISLNDERKRLTEECFNQVVEDLNQRDSLDKIIVYYNSNVPNSVAGIVAGRVKEMFNRPTIIFSKEAKGLKGSGRSIDAYNLFNGIEASSKYLDSFGGHALAAGVVIQEENLDNFRKDINSKCNLSDKDFIRKVNIDAVLPLSALTTEFVCSLDLLPPYGKDNLPPRFISRKVQVKKLKFVGKDRRYVQFSFVKGNKFYNGTYFSDFEKFKEEFCKIYDITKFNDIYLNDAWVPLWADIVFYPALNVYNGNTTVQLQLTNFKFYKSIVGGRR